MSLFRFLQSLKQLEQPRWNFFAAYGNVIVAQKTRDIDVFIDCRSLSRRDQLFGISFGLAQFLAQSDCLGRPKISRLWVENEITRWC